jgi:hypothetical protein
MMRATSMASDARRPRVHVDSDGVKTQRQPRAGGGLGTPAALLALAAGATVAVFLILRFAAGERPAEAPQVSATTGAVAIPADDAVARSRLPAEAPATQIAAQAERRTSGRVRRRQTGERQERSSSAPNHQADPERPETATAGERGGEEELHARDVIPALIASGEKGGIALFPLPGTDPIKTGIIVPEDFELPEGFVRHFQTDDDGKRLPPILTVHPDYDLVNERGEVVPLPDGRVVPPDLAPAGMPIRMLAVPRPGGAAE